MNRSFKEIEDKLCKYFNKSKLTDAFNAKLILLEKQIEAVEKDLRECNLSIEPESKSPSFDERVQTSSDGMSYVEREIMRVTELKIKRKIEKQLEREKVLEQLDDLEKECNDTEWKIRDFTGELKTLLELKYKKGYGEEKIGLEMHLSQSQINKRKQQLIKKIDSWDRWINAI